VDGVTDARRVGVGGVGVAIGAEHPAPKAAVDVGAGQQVGALPAHEEQEEDGGGRAWQSRNKVYQSQKTHNYEYLLIIEFIND